MRARLFLITPRSFDVAEFAPRLEEALAAGDVATVLIAPDVTSASQLQRIAEILVPIVQAHDAAALVIDDSRIMGRAKADGVHVVSGGEALAEAIEALHPTSIVGAGNLRGRHEAMMAGETEADYVFFGLLDLEETPEPHRKTMELGSWWAELFEPPCVLLAGSSIDSVKTCALTGADFVAVRGAIWDHPDGPAAAIRAANLLLDEVAPRFPDE